MKVLHHRLGKEVALSNATIFMSQGRNNVEVAYPGDIIGIHNHGTIKIGDTFTEKERLKFTGVPSFVPEHFRRVILKNPLKAKQLNKGLAQMAEEGAVQVFQPITGSRHILGAVGVLQFDVTMARLKEEYGVDAVYEPVEYGAARWVSCEDRKKLEAFRERNEANLALDNEDHLSFLARNEWVVEDTMKQFPEVSFHKTREFN
jgi:peptide chain release factor 3